MTTTAFRNEVTELQNEINTLGQQRAAFIAAEQKRLAGKGGGDAMAAASRDGWLVARWNDTLAAAKETGWADVMDA